MACRSLPTRPRLGVTTVRKKRNSRRCPAPMAASPGPMLPVLTEISLTGVPESFIAVMRVRASRWWRSGGESIMVLGLGRLAEFGPRAGMTTSAPRVGGAGEPGGERDCADQRAG